MGKSKLTPEEHRDNAIGREEEKDRLAKENIEWLMETKEWREERHMFSISGRSLACKTGPRKVMFIDLGRKQTDFILDFADYAAESMPDALDFVDNFQERVDKELAAIKPGKWITENMRAAILSFKAKFGEFYIPKVMRFRGVEESDFTS